PVYYPSVTIDGRRFADGGLRGPLPLAPAARSGAAVVVAVDTGPGFDASAPDARLPAPPLLRAHDDATGILMAAVTAAELALWRALPARPHLVYVRPRCERGVTFRTDLAEAYLEEGYRATRAALDREPGLAKLRR
ncbi:MAG TPA: hypothetical protein VNK43_06650, partial [Gemmatimonadales bacterium]|nr:hypothetical protein [Gemmatimonadales bacterium]